MEAWKLAPEKLIWKLLKHPLVPTAEPISDSTCFVGSNAGQLLLAVLTFKNAPCEMIVGIRPVKISLKF
jgi:hypothetical protein